VKSGHARVSRGGRGSSLKAAYVHPSAGGESLQSPMEIPTQRPSGMCRCPPSPSGARHNVFVRTLWATAGFGRALIAAGMLLACVRRGWVDRATSGDAGGED
jgi:hypothetical protein